MKKFKALFFIYILSVPITSYCDSYMEPTLLLYEYFKQRNLQRRSTYHDVINRISIDQESSGEASEKDQWKSYLEEEVKCSYKKYCKKIISNLILYESDCEISKIGSENCVEALKINAIGTSGSLHRGRGVKLHFYFDEWDRLEHVNVSYEYQIKISNTK